MIFFPVHARSMTCPACCINKEEENPWSFVIAVMEHRKNKRLFSLCFFIASLETSCSIHGNPTSLRQAFINLGCLGTRKPRLWSADRGWPLSHKTSPAQVIYDFLRMKGCHEKAAQEPVAAQLKLYDFLAKHDERIL